MIAPLFFAAAQAMTFTADRIAADDATRSLAATGHVTAVSGPMRLHGEYLTRDADGTMIFHDPVCATTCTNAPGHTHWNVSGEVEYREADYVILRNTWLRFCEYPIFWLPYMYYSLKNTDCGFSWMPGYTGRWGGYLLTRYAYHLLGDSEHDETTYWLTGATRFDMRYRQGLAFGEDLEWNLGDWGRGKFSLYYAWDRSAEEYYGYEKAAYSDTYHSYNWESPVKTDRYAVNLTHRTDLTERDSLRLRAFVMSDSAFREDFDRDCLFNWQQPWRGYENSGLFWEHVENAFAVGGELSGRLNDFYGMTDRLPEFYLNLNPVPVFGLPVNYETENRIGYLRRNPAEYGTSDPFNAYAFNPGVWAYYEAFRFDTYHRLTAPFRTFDDVLSVVPRVGFRGTGWSESGSDNLTGWGGTEEKGALFRSILEGGTTFAGRGVAWINDSWRHMVEPYFDVLAQQAWMSGDGRPYVFDNLDESYGWEDQFAGRGRNLPYSYYGVTPGIRNGWDKADDRGNLRTIVDFDVYAALQFGQTDYSGIWDSHCLSDPGDPHYGKHGCEVVPGARVRWTPDEDLMLMARAEYDADNNRIAVADAGLVQKVSKNLSYNIKYTLRDYRCWDFSSSPYDPSQMTADEFNYAKFHYIHVGFENQPLDWFAWGPYVRWDIRQAELDRIGSWFDYLTDCLGFRFIAEYQNAYTRLDGYERKEDWSVGFYIYLRAFGPGSGGALGFQ